MLLLMLPLMMIPLRGIRTNPQMTLELGRVMRSGVGVSVSGAADYDPFSVAAGRTSSRNVLVHVRIRRLLLGGCGMIMMIMMAVQIAGFGSRPIIIVAAMIVMMMMRMVLRLGDGHLATTAWGMGFDVDDVINAHRRVVRSIIFCATRRVCLGVDERVCIRVRPIAATAADSHCLFACKCHASLLDAWFFDKEEGRILDRDLDLDGKG